MESTLFSATGVLCLAIMQIYIRQEQAKLRLGATLFMLTALCILTGTMGELTLETGLVMTFAWAFFNAFASVVRMPHFLPEKIQGFSSTQLIAPDVPEVTVGQVCTPLARVPFIKDT